MRPVSKKSLLAALLVFFVDNFGLYVVLPIFTPLILKAQGSILEAPISIEGRMFFLSILIASFPCAQFFGAPLFGSFGDKHGRKKALLLTLTGESIGYIASAVAIHINNYGLLIASRAFTGFFAGNLAICLAIISDHTKEKITRYRLYGVQTGLLGISFALAVLIGGFLSNNALAKGFDPSLPFWITAAIALCNIVLISALYEEATLPPAESTAFHPFRTGRLIQIFTAFFFFAFAYLPTLQYLSAFVFEQYDSTRYTTSLLFAGVGIVWFVGSTFISRPLLKRIQPEKQTLIATQLTCLFLFFGCISPTFTFFSASYLIYILLASLAWLGMTTKVSFDCPEQERGQLLGFMQSILTVAALLGPIIVGYFGRSSLLSGYYFALSMHIVAAVILYYYKQKFIPSFTEK